MTESSPIPPVPGRVADRDSETARLLMSGDPEGVSRLLADHSRKVLGLLRKEFTKVLDLQEIEDVVSQASLRVWRAGGRYDPQRGTLSAWLYVIARNCARRMIEAKKRHPAVAFVDNLDSAAGGATVAPPALDEALAREAEAKPKDKFLHDVQVCIHELAPQQRSVLLADLAAGGTASTAELAEQLNTSRNSIYVSRNNGRKALRAAMLKRGHSFDDASIRSLEGWS